MKKKKLSNRHNRFVYILTILPMMLCAMSGPRALASHPGVITETIYYPVTLFMGASCVSPQSDVPPPTFVGGKQAMNKYLSDHVKYPEDARKAGISGVVLVQFDVTSDGSVDNVSVSRSLYPSLDKEALRVISAMPKWNTSRLGCRSHTGSGVDGKMESRPKGRTPGSLSGESAYIL